MPGASRRLPEAPESLYTVQRARESQPMSRVPFQPGEQAGSAAPADSGKEHETSAASKHGSTVRSHDRACGSDAASLRTLNLRAIGNLTTPVKISLESPDVYGRACRPQDM